MKHPETRCNALKRIETQCNTLKRPWNARKAYLLVYEALYDPFDIPWNILKCLWNSRKAHLWACKAIFSSLLWKLGHCVQ